VLALLSGKCRRLTTTTHIGRPRPFPCWQVQDATEVFRRYCLRQVVMKGGAPASQLPRLPSSLPGKDGAGAPT
jgi:hypothetical protein